MASAAARGIFPRPERTLPSSARRAFHTHPRDHGAVRGCIQQASRGPCIPRLKVLAEAADIASTPKRKRAAKNAAADASTINAGQTRRCDRAARGGFSSPPWPTDRRAGSGRCRCPVHEGWQALPPRHTSCPTPCCWRHEVRHRSARRLRWPCARTRRSAHRCHRHGAGSWGSGHCARFRP